MEQAQPVAAALALLVEPAAAGGVRARAGPVRRRRAARMRRGSGGQYGKGASFPKQVAFPEGQTRAGARSGAPCLLFCR